MNKKIDIPVVPEFHVPKTCTVPKLSEEELKKRISRIAGLLKAQDATIIAHYYVDASIQRLADETGGFVGDSLAMAQFGRKATASTLMVSGVRFMGESAKILSPEKRVLMPTLQAECSLDLGCPAEAFKQFCHENSDRTVVVYANTSAAVKALADWVVTSSNALDIVAHLDASGEKILWAPDRYLGNYIQRVTGADMLLWQGACVVHEEFKSQALAALRKQYPNAAVLVHPESPPAVIEQATVIGSTSRLIKATQELPNKQFIVATDRGIFYKMKQASPDKEFIEAPTAGVGATCRSCGHCPWMAMNNLENLEHALLAGDNEIELTKEVIERARIPLERMVNFNNGKK